jgi:hypothetical protein
MREIAGAEVHRDGQHELGRRALFQGLGQLLAVNDEFAEKGENQAGTERHGAAVLIRVGIGGIG